MKKYKREDVPLVPTVRDELLFQTGAPEFVVKNGELKALDGRYWPDKDKKRAWIANQSFRN